jgi:hypothetical protein
VTIRAGRVRRACSATRSASSSARVEQAAAWWLGDLLRDERWDEGRKYATAAAATGLKIRRLYTFCWVARSVPRERRRRELSWSHHRAIARLPPGEQVDWLQRAVDERLTVSDLSIALGDEADNDVPVMAARVRARRQIPRPDELALLCLEIRAPARQIERWRAVASARGLSLVAIATELLTAELEQGDCRL